MDTHVRVLGVIHIALSVLGLLTAAIVGFGLGSVVGIVWGTADPEEAAVAVPIIGMVGSALVAFLLAMSLPGLIAGIGLLYFKQWARVLAIVLSAVSLLGFPWLTLLGIYGLWVLLSKDGERLFVPARLGAPEHPA